jgi:O-antigen ligase
MVIVIGGILVTHSRGGMLGLVSVCTTVCFLDKEKRKRNLILLVLGVALAAVIIPSAIERMESITDPEKDKVGSMQARIETIKSGLCIFAENPFLGVGVSCFEIAEGARHGGAGSWSSAHNMWIEVAAETGLPGLVGFFGCVFAVLKSLYRIKSTVPYGSEQRYIAEGLFCSMVGFIVCGTFLSMSSSWSLFYLIGLTAALENVNKSVSTGAE